MTILGEILIGAGIILYLLNFLIFKTKGAIRTIALIGILSGVIVMAISILWKI